MYGVRRCGEAPMRYAVRSPESFSLEPAMTDLRHPSRGDVVIQHSHHRFTVAHGSHRDEVRCSTFVEALDRAERFAAADHTSVWYQQEERKRMTRLDERLIRRVWGEFMEQPGLALTRAQAQRLWALDEITCADLLDTLSEAGLLFFDGTGRYRLPSAEGAWRRTSARMAKARFAAGGPAAFAPQSKSPGH